MQLLKTKLGVEALKLVEQPTASYLEAYQHGWKLAEPSFEGDLQLLEWQLLDNKALWRPDSHKSSRWICKLAFALLIRAKTPHLRVCHLMVHNGYLFMLPKKHLGRP